jgi:CRP/FNR family nitrogen fixation transcriptional regulator
MRIELQTGLASPLPTVAARRGGVSVDARCRSIEPLGARVPYARDVEIYGENEPAEYLYKVISGAVRTYKVLVDGRRQICAFHLSGDFFGFEADDAYAFSAEAITDSSILLMKRSTVMTLAKSDGEVARQLLILTSDQLRRVHGHALLLIKSAKERVADFLLEMAEREAVRDQVALPMSRQDIADYLGLTIETVSRTLTELERRGAIALPTSRHVMLRNREALVRSRG